MHLWEEVSKFINCFLSPGECGRMWCFGWNKRDITIVTSEPETQTSMQWSIVMSGQWSIVMSILETRTSGAIWTLGQIIGFRHLALSERNSQCLSEESQNLLWLFDCMVWTSYSLDHAVLHPIFWSIGSFNSFPTPSGQWSNTH